MARFALLASAVLVACSSDSDQSTDPSGSNNPPDVSITEPADSTSFVTGEQVGLVGVAIDPEDGVLGGAFLVWSSGIDGVLGTGAEVSTPFLSIGEHTITLSATDRENLTSSAAITLTVIPDVPPAPSDLVATAVSATEVDLRWDDHAEAESEYQLERERQSPQGAGIQSPARAYELVTRLPADTRTYRDTGLTPGTPYLYRVAACNENGCSEFASLSEPVVTFETESPQFH